MMLASQTNVNSLVYVESEGMLKFTQAHSAIMPPLNSIMGGWHRCAPVNYGFGKFTWSDSKGSGGFVVCGVEPVGAWEVYALMAGIPQPACETIGLLISKDDFEISGVSAWEYE
jgi:hypothetical protein